MKELSLEEKAKRYDIALDKIKMLLGTGSSISREELKYIFPELKESEDEKIRERLLELFKEHWSEEWYGLKVKDVIAWLEKQGEQKPAFEMKTPEESLGIDSNTYNKIVDECIYGDDKSTWSEEDEERLQSCLNILQAKGLMGATDTINTKWLKSLKDRVLPQPKQGWSEEDLSMIGRIRSIIEKYAFSQSAVDVNGELCEKEFIDADNWLKSLRPQKQWKPSEEQMQQLGWVAEQNKDNMIGKELMSLYQDLKKLKS